MADDDLDFDFEGTLAREAATYQGASVSRSSAELAGRQKDGGTPGRRTRVPLSSALTPHDPRLCSPPTPHDAQAGPGGPVPTIAPGTQLGQSLTNFKKNFRQVRERDGHKEAGGAMPRSVGAGHGGGGMHRCVAVKRERAHVIVMHGVAGCACVSGARARLPASTRTLADQPTFSPLPPTSACSHTLLSPHPHRPSAPTG